MADSPLPPPGPASDEVLSRLSAMIHLSPQARALGLQLERVDGGKLWGRAPYAAQLVGNPDTGVIAGGVVTTFLDHLCGTAAVAAMENPTLVATIDLRIDYMRGAVPGRDVLAEAHCVKLTRHVAFVRAVAYDETPDDPIAHASATFMIDPGHARRAPS